MIFRALTLLMMLTIFPACGVFGQVDESAAAFGSFSGSVSGAITFYGYDDNDNGSGTRGSASIAYPGLHDKATEDLGTYDRPSTFATDKRVARRGTRIYIPQFRKYYIMEDVCGACADAADRGLVKVDLFMGGNTGLQGPALRACQRAKTHSGFTQEIIFNPAPGYPVSTKPLFKDGDCNMDEF